MELEKLLGIIMDNNKIDLPIAVVSPTDIARLTRELVDIDEFLVQSAIRKGGQRQTIPRYSRLLDEVVVSNKLNLLQEDDRHKLLASFKNLTDTAPVVHISFSSDPPGPYIQKIVFWFRQNIRRDVLLSVGLQPNIAAGCIVRTNSKSFDLSLKRFFQNKKDFFQEILHKAVQSEINDQPTVVSTDEVVSNVSSTETDEVSKESVFKVPEELNQDSTGQTIKAGA
jgi:F0F1-type ATP synthase delta subunit